MSRTSLWRLIMVTAAVLLLTVTFASGGRAAAADGSGGDALTAAMLHDSDLPAGFQPYAPLTGPLDAARAQKLGIDASKLGVREWQVRTWIAPHQATVIEIAADGGTHDAAQAAVAAAGTALLEQRYARQSIAGPVPLAAFGTSGQTGAGRLFLLVLPMARGPYFFVLRVYAPAPESAGGLMSALAAAQVRRVPASTPDTASPDNVSTDAAATTGGALVGYLLIVDGIAYLRNPLRRKLRRGRPARPQPRPGVTDVSAAAKKNKRAAVLRLAVQLAGLTLAAYGADVYFVRYWYAYLVAGLAIVWAGGRFIHPAGVRRDKNRAIAAGRHKILVTGMRAVASAMILLGLAAAVFYGLYQVLPQQDAVTLVPGQAPTPVQTVSSSLEVAVFCLVAVGAVIFRIAGRLGAIHARQLMQRDPRPPVLYLRAFGDDRLKLWTATFGRPSLIERFTLRRFDTFEQVLVRHLSRYGPVIAVNPPKTRLAPLGAARETIDSDDWQSVVAAWMAEARLVVFVTPPNQVTPGLLWELETVSARGWWDKALVVVPPVRAAKLQARWQQFWAERPGWPFTVPGAIGDPQALVLAFRNDQWQVTAADRRSEWSYGAALTHLLGDSRRLAGVTPGHAAPGRPAARRSPVTLLAAGLVVLLAGAAAGAGSWYAFGSKPVARQSPVAAASAAPSSPSSPSQPAPGGSSAEGSLAGSSSPTASPSLVSIAPAAAQYPAAGQITPVITEYFQAINERDYAGYLTTESPGNALSAQQFQTGYESTADSDVLVTSMFTAPDGRPAADVTFTSRQQPQDGPDGESCTSWQVTLFFDFDGANYTIGSPPGYYRASQQAC
ncbi:MAG TPA: hypothetical protein VGS06_14240 [Streptosporangiaceae bacterium]|nr:hypothetical protein [Streptosporangiaceae bacterium]